MVRPLRHWADSVLPAGTDYDAIPSPGHGASPRPFRRSLRPHLLFFSHPVSIWCAGTRLSLRHPCSPPLPAALPRRLAVTTSNDRLIHPALVPARRYESRSSPERPPHLRFPRPFLGARSHRLRRSAPPPRPGSCQALRGPLPLSSGLPTPPRLCNSLVPPWSPPPSPPRRSRPRTRSCPRRPLIGVVPRPTSTSSPRAMAPSSRPRRATSPRLSPRLCLLWRLLALLCLLWCLLARLPSLSHTPAARGASHPHRFGPL